MKKILYVVGILGVLLLAIYGYCTLNASCPDSMMGEQAETVCSCPPYGVTINLQPYGNYTQKEAKALKAQLDVHLQPLWDGVADIEVLPVKPLPKRAYYKPRNRYRAGELLKDLKCSNDNNVVTIGLTHCDISTTIHGHKDYGIMGYSYCPGNVCVVSSFRMKGKDDMWKCVIHEFLHSRGLPHCENAECYMKDAHGKGAIYKQKGLCTDCTKRLAKVKM